MIHQIDLRKNGESILLGIAIREAVLDIVTSESLIQDCLRLLHEPNRGIAAVRMGSFGSFDVTLSLSVDGTVAIMVDGPDFERNRTQSSGIWIEKTEIHEILSIAQKRAQDGF